MIKKLLSSLMDRGGTGNTFLYKTLLASIRSKGFIAIATATSGVATSLLPGGRTAHSRFKIPQDGNDIKGCQFSKQSSTAKLIQEAKLIIWDEAPMAKKEAIENFVTMLQDITGNEILFGGKVVVFEGDFRQVLPAIPKASKELIIECSLLCSHIWPVLKKIKLTQNMRAIDDPAFTAYL
jgi:hypothetical protein